LNKPGKNVPMEIEKITPDNILKKKSSSKDNVRESRNDEDSSRLKVIDGSPLLIIIIILISVFTRLFRLSYHSIWLDEAHLIWIAMRPPAQIIEFVKIYELHPPLYYLFIHYILLIGRSEFILRLPSVLAGIAEVYGAYLLGSEAWNRRAGLLAAFFMSLSVFEILFSQEIRMYPFLLLFIILAAYNFLKALNTGKTKYWIFYAISALLGLYTDYRIIFILTAAFIFFFICFDTYKGHLKPLLITHISIAILFAPLIRMLLHQSGPAGGGTSLALFFSPPDADKILRSIFALFGGYILPLNNITIYLLVLGILAVLFTGPYYMYREKGKSSFYLAFIFIFSLAAMSGYAMFRTRIYSVKHTIFLSPIFLTLLASAVLAIRKKYKVVFSLIIGAFLILNLFSLYLWYFNPHYQKQDFRAVVNVIQANMKQGDKIVIVPEYTWYPFKYYYRGKNQVYAVVPRTMNRAIKELGNTERVWWIFSGDRVIDPEGTIRKWVSQHYKIKRQVIFPHIPYEVTGESIEVYLGEKIMNRK